MGGWVLYPGLICWSKVGTEHLVKVDVKVGLKSVRRFGTVPFQTVGLHAGLS